MKQYFDNGWNKFDFFIVMISFIGSASRTRARES